MTGNPSTWGEPRLWHPDLASAAAEDAADVEHLRYMVRRLGEPRVPVIFLGEQWLGPDDEPPSRRERILGFLCDGIPPSIFGRRA